MNKKINPLRSAAFRAAERVRDKNLDLDQKIVQAYNDCITDKRVKQLDISENRLESYLKALIRKILVSGGDRVGPSIKEK